MTNIISNYNALSLLPRSFFDAPPEQVARRLLGKLLVHSYDKMRLVGRIVETEAYLGEHDPAAHAASGRTARNAVLYGPPGHAYVYGIYGLHFCLNVSCREEGNPGCVLVRALEPLQGLDTMRKNRRLDAKAPPRLLASGPGKLCQALGITRPAYNGVDLANSDSPLGIYRDNFVSGEIVVTPRIGVRKAADLPLRYFLAGYDCVSGTRTLSIKRVLPT
ncbi:MAG: DNA-3-methyladenine glycosylase [Acidobacteriaceae bacterium]